MRAMQSTIQLLSADQFSSSPNSLYMHSKDKICCIFNLAPHYRSAIYQKMDQELACDFYFGDKVHQPIKLMNPKELKGYKRKLINKRILNTSFKWQKGACKLIFKPYKHYIITGDASYLSNWFLAIMGRLLGKKIYAWTHGPKGNPMAKRTFIAKNFYRLCHKVLLYGKYSRNIMLTQGFPEEKLVCVYNSLDYEKQLEVRKKLKKTNVFRDYFKNDFPVLIYIGRIQRSKKLDMLIQVLKNLKDNGVNCNLAIVGPSAEKNDIPKLVTDLNIEDNVWFHGAVYDENKIGNLLYNADVCVIPGAIGLTALHAMVYGTPLITNDRFYAHGPEFEVIKPGVTGDFYKDGDIQDLARKILVWLNLDNTSRELVRKKAYKVIDSKYNPFYQIRAFKQALNRA